MSATFFSAVSESFICFYPLFWKTITSSSSSIYESESICRQIIIYNLISINCNIIDRIILRFLFNRFLSSAASFSGITGISLRTTFCPPSKTHHILYSLDPNLVDSRSRLEAAQMGSNMGDKVDKREDIKNLKVKGASHAFSRSILVKGKDDIWVGALFL